jgi:hypothetical protein
MTDDTRQGSPGHPLTVGDPLSGIADKPNLSACPGRIDGDKKDTFRQVDPDLSELNPATTAVEVY